MLAFLLRRILLGVVVLWAITTVVFVMFFVAPTHVAQLIAGRQATPETVALVPHRLGLDRPVLTQYCDYLWRLLHGDLGYSYYNSTPVTTLIGAARRVTASLALGAAVLWLLIGISSGVLASTRPRSMRRPRRDRLGALLLLDADLPARADPAVLPLLPAHAGRRGCLPAAAATSRSPRTRWRGPSTCSCPGSRWPW